MHRHDQEEEDDDDEEHEMRQIGSIVSIGLRHIECTLTSIHTGIMLAAEVLLNNSKVTNYNVLHLRFFLLVSHFPILANFFLQLELNKLRLLFNQSACRA